MTGAILSDGEGLEQSLSQGEQAKEVMEPLSEAPRGEALLPMRSAQVALLMVGSRCGFLDVEEGGTPHERAGASGVKHAECMVPFPLRKGHVEPTCLPSLRRLLQEGRVAGRML